MDEQILGEEIFVVEDSQGILYDLKCMVIKLFGSDYYFETRYKKQSQKEDVWTYLVSTDISDLAQDLDEVGEVDATIEKFINDLEDKIDTRFGSGGSTKPTTGIEALIYILQNELYEESNKIIRKT